MARQGKPACQQGLTSPSPLKNTRLLLCAIPTQPTTATSPTQSLLQKDIPCQEAFTNAQAEQRSQIPTGRVSTSRDLQVQASTPEGQVHMLRAMGLGQPLPTEPPMLKELGEGDLLPLPTTCVGQSRARRHAGTTHPQPHSNLNSQPCAERQLSSSLAVISRTWHLLTEAQQERGLCLAGEGQREAGFFRLFYLPPFLWLPVPAGISLEAAPVGRSLICSSPGSAGDPSDFGRLWITPSRNSLEISAQESRALGWAAATSTSCSGGGALRPADWSNSNSH